MNKRIKYILILIACVALLAGLIVGVVLLVENSQIEDTNGPDDYSLCQLTMEDLLKNNASSSGSRISESSSGMRSHVRGGYEEHDYTKCTFKAKKVSGTRALHATKTNSDKLTLTIDSQCQSGNLELIILVDGEYYASVPINSVETIVLEDISGKLVLVKIGAESANVKITVKRSIG